jgi:hypothetical protein
MNIYAAILFFISTALSVGTVFGQDLNFNILPLAINPAFTGMFDGKLRTTGLYKNLALTSKVNFIAYGASADARILIKQTGYWAVGLGGLQGKVSNGSLDNTSCIISVAYHKNFIRADKNTRKRMGEIAAGIQTGYIQRSLHLAGTNTNSLPLVYHTGAGANYFIINAGLSFSQLLGEKFNYSVGISGNNLNLLNDGTTNTEHPLLRVTPSGTALLIANWRTGERLALRPAILHIINTNFFIAGNEFRYQTSKISRSHVAFINVWYRSTKIFSLAPGYEFKRLRVAFELDYRVLSHNTLDYAGLQFNVRYIVN